MSAEVRDIAERFELLGEVVSVTPFGSGHINDTYAVECDTTNALGRLMLQRVNHGVFPDVPALMSNVSRVCDHVQARLEREGTPDLDRRCLTLIPTRQGEAFTRDDVGSYWRMFRLIENATGHDLLTSPSQAYEAARAFGRFQQLLSDLPAPRLHDTIPDFHHTPKRVAAFHEALSRDVAGRAAEAADEIRWLIEHQHLADQLLALRDAGDAPERVVHNDAKLNNVLLDDSTHEALCVVDLDTVMPGLALYDFGDLVRTSVSPAVEDEPDLGRVLFRAGIFEALVRGYLFDARSFLTQAEIEHLPTAGMVITYTMGVRFLTDFLNGDVYYKTRHMRHNLNRCRTQWRLLEHMELQRRFMQRCVLHA